MERVAHLRGLKQGRRELWLAQVEADETVLLSSHDAEVYRDQGRCRYLAKLNRNNYVGNLTVSFKIDEMLPLNGDEEDPRTGAVLFLKIGRSFAPPGSVARFRPPCWRFYTEWILCS